MVGQNKKLRPDIVEMLKKTASQLTRKQKIEAHTLLDEYTSLFAKSKKWRSTEVAQDCYGNKSSDYDTTKKSASPPYKGNW